jgi:hypothetical protein
MKNLKFAVSLFVLFNINLVSDNSLNKFSKDDIERLAGIYIAQNPCSVNPVFTDIDNDGDFDALNIDEGNVEFYKNTGTLNEPVFILEDKNYDSYTTSLFLNPKIPYPLFFADMDNDNDPDMFIVKVRIFERSKIR